MYKRQVMTPVAAYGYLVFNLLCAPCFAAMGAIKREMNNTKWTLARKSALSYKAQENAIIIVEDFTFEAPKTRCV